MRLSTDGLIIKENNTGESDRVVAVLTRDKGVIRAFVPGARNLRNKNASSTGMLCYSNLTFYKNRDTYKVDEASAIEVFFSLRNDIVKLTIAQYICELCLHLAPTEEAADDFLRLALNSLSFLSNDKISPILIKSITEFRIICLAGYMPNLLACKECAKYESDVMFFDFTDGSIYCESCKGSHTGLFPVNKTVLTAMRHIVYSDFRKLYSFSIPEDDIKQLSSVTERFLLSQTEYTFKTLSFLNIL
ncbi:MAG: DNA repair protein RecO [Oscillospiraceae bacterium]